MARSIYLDFQVNDTELKHAATVLETMAKKIADADAKFDHFNKSVSKSAASFAKMARDAEKVANSTDKLSDNLKEVKKGLDGVGKAAADAGAHLGEAKKGMAAAGRAADKMGGQMDGAAAGAEKLAEKLGNLKKNSEGIAANLKGAGSAAGKMGGAMGGAKLPPIGGGGGGGGGLGGMLPMLGGMSAGFAAVGAAAVAAGAAIYSSLKSAYVLINDQLLPQINAVRGRFSEFADDWETQGGEVVNMGERLIASMTGIVQAAAASSGLEFGESLEFINSQMSAFGQNALDAAADLSVMTTLVGPDKAGDVVDWAREYGTQFRALGLSAQTLRNVMINSFSEGVFDDKAFDFLKEFKNKLNDFSTAEEKILKDNNLFQYIEQIRSGAVPLEDGLLKITDKLNEMNKAGKDIRPLAKALGGGPGEDLGQTILRMREILTLTDEQKAMVDKLEKAKKREILTQAEANAEMNLLVTQIQPALQRGGAAVQSVWATVKTVFFQIARYLYEHFKPQIDAIIEGMEWFADTLRSSGQVMTTIMTVVRAVVLVFESLWDIIKSVVQWATFFPRKILAMVASFMGLKGAAQGAGVYIQWFGNALAIVAGIAADAVKIFGQLLEAIWNLATFDFGALAQNMKNIVGVFTGGQTVKAIKALGQPPPKITPAMVDPADLNVGDPQAPGATGALVKGAEAGKEEKEKRDREKEMLDERLIILKEDYNQRKRLLDFSLEKKEIDEKKHAQASFENEKAYEKEKFELERTFLENKLKINRATSERIINSREAFNAFASKLDQDGYDKAFELFQKASENRDRLREIELEREKKFYEIQKAEEERQKQASIKRNKETYDELLDQNAYYYEVLLENTNLNELEKYRIEQAALEARRKLIEARLVDYLAIHNLTEEERVAAIKEAGQEVEKITRAQTKNFRDESAARIKVMREFKTSMMSEMLDVAGSVSPILKSVADAGKAFGELEKKLKEIQKLEAQAEAGGGLPSFDKKVLEAQKFATVLQMVGAALEGVAGMVKGIQDARLAAVDSEIAAHQKQMERLKEINEAEKERNETMYERQAIDNALAEQRIIELERLRTQIPAAEKEQLEQSIKNERARIKDIDKMRAKDEKSQNDKLAREEQKQKELEEKKRRIQSQTFEIERVASITKTLIAGAIAAVQAFALLGPIAGAIAAAAVGVFTAGQVAVIASQKNPYALAEGTLSVPGKIKNKDSVPAMLMPGEAVIPTKTNEMYADAVAAIYNRTISPEILNAFVKGHSRPDRYAGAAPPPIVKVEQGPMLNINVDENGFEKWAVSAHEKRKYLNKKLHLKM